MLTGGSGVIGPDANWIAGPVHNEEVILYADLDLAHASRERYAMDTVGHYNRPDIFESDGGSRGSGRRSRGWRMQITPKLAKRPPRLVNESCMN